LKNANAGPQHSLLIQDPAQLALMAAVADYIAEHYASDLRMADLAMHCHVSVRTLQNLFHGHCGEPPLRALRRYRLQQLHRSILERPWTPLRQLYRGCGLTGSVADRDLFLEIYGLTIREHQEGCRVKVTPIASVPLASTAPKADLERFVSKAA
jgi:AraC-like DNA-binding protein